MLKDRKVLEEKVTAILKLNNNNNQFKEKFIKQLTNKIKPTQIIDIINGKLPTKFLMDIDLFLVTNAIYNNITNFVIKNEIKPTLWFTDIEINQGESKFINDTEDALLIIKNVKQVEDDIFLSYKVSAQFIAKAFENGFSLYNPDTQRAGVKKEIYGEEIIVPRIFDDSVKGVSQEIKQNSYLPTLLTWNIIAQEGDEEIYKYNPQTEELTIRKSAIVDGQNRTMGVVKAILENATTDCFFYLQLYVDDVVKSQRFIVQESKHHPVDDETIQYLTPSKFMDIAKHLNEYGSQEINMMFSNIEKTSKDVLNLNKYTTFEVLDIAIEDCFAKKIQIPRDNNKIKEYLIDFFNEFLGIEYEYFKDVEKTRKDYVIADINMFIGYVYLASTLYKKEDWKNKLEIIVKNIDWKRENKIWKETRYWGNIKPASRKRLYEAWDYIIKDEREVKV